MLILGSKLTATTTVLKCLNEHDFSFGSELWFNHFVWTDCGMPFRRFDPLRVFPLRANVPVMPVLFRNRRCFHDAPNNLLTLQGSQIYSFLKSPFESASAWIRLDLCLYGCTAGRCPTHWAGAAIDFGSETGFGVFLGFRQERRDREIAQKIWVCGNESGSFGHFPMRKDSETIDSAETQCAGMPTIRPVAGVGRWLSRSSFSWR